MSFRLKINDKTDQKLLQNFPNDPYTDIKIVTRSLEFDLSLAYLGIDSQYFAEVPSNCSEVDLSELNEQFLVSVLRALYGGELEATSVADLEQIYKVIDYLRIDEFKNSLAQNLKNMHQAKKETSPLNLVEMIEFCMKSGLLKDYVLQYHFENRLKVLQSSKNYLQLGKLTDNSLNKILLQFSEREGEKGDSIINHILENYFNRKSYRPADYFQDPQLTILRFIWEKFHHKVNMRASKIEKTTSIKDLKETAPIPSFRSTQTGFNKFGRLANMTSINTQSINLTSQLYKSQKIGEQAMIDMRLATLSKELENKTKKIQNLQAELRELQELKMKRDAKKQMESSIDDETLLKNVARSRKSRQEQLRRGDNSLSSNQFALDNIKKVRDQEREGKIKIVSKTTMNKKIFN